MVGPIKRRGQGRWVSGRRRLRGQASSPVAEALRRRVAVRARRRRQAIAKLYAVIERPTGSAGPVSADASTRPSFRACPSTPGLATRTTARRPETRPGRGHRVGWTFTLLAAGPCKARAGHNPHVPVVPRPGFSGELPQTLRIAFFSPRRPRSGASRRRGRGSLEAAATMGTKPRRAERSEGRTMNPRDRPLWYEGRGRYRRAAGPRRGRRRNDAAVNSPGEWARRSPRYSPFRSDRGNSGERRKGGAVAAWAERRSVMWKPAAAESS
jgi:hypothetical protein